MDTGSKNRLALLRLQTCTKPTNSCMIYQQNQPRMALPSYLAYEKTNAYEKNNKLTRCPPYVCIKK